jgi:hypothetical protein
MSRWGYLLDHASDGYMLTKAGYTYRQIYLAFKKVPSEYIPEESRPKP